VVAAAEDLVPGVALAEGAAEDAAAAVGVASHAGRGRAAAGAASTSAGRRRRTRRAVGEGEDEDVAEVVVERLAAMISSSDGTPPSAVQTSLR